VDHAARADSSCRASGLSAARKQGGTPERFVHLFGSLHDCPYTYSLNHLPVHTSARFTPSSRIASPHAVSRSPGVAGPPSCASDSLVGSVNQKVAPPPGVSSTPISPSWASMISLQMERPRPAPAPRVPGTRKNLSKTFQRYSDGMPLPLSAKAQGASQEKRKPSRRSHPWLTALLISTQS